MKETQKTLKIKGYGPHFIRDIQSATIISDELIKQYTDINLFEIPISNDIFIALWREINDNNGYHGWLLGGSTIYRDVFNEDKWMAAFVFCREGTFP